MSFLVSVNWGNTKTDLGSVPDQVVCALLPTPYVHFMLRAGYERMMAGVRAGLIQTRHVASLR